MTERVLFWGIGGSARALIELVAQQGSWSICSGGSEQPSAFPTERVVAIVEASSITQTAAACELLRARCTDVRILVLIQPSISEEALWAICHLADDYLHQPVLESELRTCVTRLYYKDLVLEPPPRHQGMARICWGPLDLRFDERILLINGTPCELTPRQERLLTRLIRAAGTIVTNEELWVDFGVATAPNLVNIRVHMHALRKRLGAEGSLIVTYPSVGYGIGVVERPLGRSSKRDSSAPRASADSSD